MKIEVCYALLDRQMLIPLEVEPSCNVEQAIRLSGLLEEFKEIDLQKITVGIYSRKVNLSQSLNEGDRIEIYRPLKIDPKEARRNKSASG